VDAGQDIVLLICVRYLNFWNSRPLAKEVKGRDCFING